MAEFTKKDLIEVIEDTIKEEMSSGSMNKNRISNISSMIKGAIESNTADDEIKGMADNIDSLNLLFVSVAENLSKSSDEKEKSFKDALSEQVSMGRGMYSEISNKFSAFMGSRVGGTLYDTLNMITDGQLGVIKSMVGQVGRVGEAVSSLYSGISDQVNTIFSQEKKDLIDPAVNAAKGVGGAMGVKSLQSKDTKKLKVAESSDGILRKILKVQNKMVGLTEDNQKISLRQRKDDIFKKLKAFFVDILVYLSGVVGFLLGGVFAQITTKFQALYYTIKMIFKPFLILGNIIFNYLTKPIKKIGIAFNFLTEIVTGTTTVFGHIKKQFTTFSAFMRGNKFLSPIIAGIEKIGGIFKFFKGIPQLGSGGGFVGKIIGKIVDSVKKFILFFKDLSKGAGILGKMFLRFKGAFAIGFKILGWPLTILMGIIDFVKGFSETEGSLGEKIIGGLKAAIMGIVEMPLKAIGWVFDKLTGGEGSGDKMVAKFSELLNGFFQGVTDALMSLWETLKSLAGHVMGVVDGVVDVFIGVWDFFVALKNFDLGGMADALSGIWDGIGEIVVGIIGGLFDIALAVPRMFIGYLKGLWPEVEKLAKGTIFEPFVWFFGKVGGIVSSIMDEIMGLVKKIPFIGDAIKTDVDKKTESVKKTSEMKKRLADIESGAIDSSGTFSFTDAAKESDKKEAIAKLKKDIAKQEEITSGFEEKTKIVKPPKDTISDATGIKDVFKEGVDSFKSMAPTVIKPSQVVEDTTNMGRDAMSSIRYMSSGKKDNTKYDDTINEMAKKYNVSPELVKSVVKTESNFNPNAKSPVGAGGLMQMMPGTAADLGVKDRFNPEQNIEGGTKYLAQLSKKYGGDMDKTLAAYNWGPGNVDKKGLGNMPKETQNYLKKVKGNLSITPFEPKSSSDIEGIVSGAEVAKQNVVKKQMEQSKNMESSVTAMNKNLKQKSETPIVVNTGGGDDRRQLDPPSDVESMSILWLNKSWGLG
jgi:hypothetical protein